MHGRPRPDLGASRRGAGQNGTDAEKPCLFGGRRGEEDESCEPVKLKTDRRRRSVIACGWEEARKAGGKKERTGGVKATVPCERQQGTSTEHVRTERGRRENTPGRGVIVILLSDGYQYFQTDPNPRLHGATGLGAARDEWGSFAADPCRGA